MKRVRVVPEPLTPYLRYGCAVTEVMPKVVRISATCCRPALTSWTCLIMTFGYSTPRSWCSCGSPVTTGRLPHEVVTDPELVARHEAWIDLAMQHATPYHKYLAQDPSREDPPPGAA